MIEQIHGFVVILGSPNDAAGNLSEIGQGRVRLGFETYRNLAAQGYRLLLTGGYGEHFNTTPQPNAYYAQRLLLDMGVPAEHILEFAESRNTVDDALKSRPIVDKYGGHHLIIVSSDFHLGRVQFVFERVFLDKRVEFLGAPYLESRAAEERERLVAHEARELKSLQERGESIVGGALRLDSWKRSVKSIEV
jgi:uncharacterized SAM-binding protein YcdF (DUF218 family)